MLRTWMVPVFLILILDTPFSLAQEEDKTLTIDGTDSAGAAIVTQGTPGQDFDPMEKAPATIIVRKKAGQKCEKSVTLRIEYDGADDVRKAFYKNFASNKLPKDPALFEKTEDWKGNEVTFTWDGRDASEANRLAVRGKTAQLILKATSGDCSGRGSLKLAPPNAVLAGYEWPSTAFGGAETSLEFNHDFGGTDQKVTLQQSLSLLADAVDEKKHKGGVLHNVPAVGKDALNGGIRTASFFAIITHANTAGLGMYAFSSKQTQDLSEEEIKNFSQFWTPFKGIKADDAGVKEGNVYDVWRNLDDLEFAFLGGCCTAKQASGEGGDTMLDAFAKRGCSFVVGFESQALFSDWLQFLKLLIEELQKDNEYENALIAAAQVPIVRPKDGGGFEQHTPFWDGTKPKNVKFKASTKPEQPDKLVPARYGRRS